MSQLPPFRIGLGYDIHTLKSGRPCILGGVAIPCEVGPEGNSDADVLLHALADAIFGAAGLRDIGHYFPNTDPKLKGIDSKIILRKAIEEVKERGWQIGNVDLVLIGERPKIMPQIDEIKKSVANLLKISPAEVGLKATTNEGMDSLGQGKAIAVQAICLLYRS
ncbi:MAG: 2-C-methyl-D-erythritol 2,4-cyclodiphosphate synthase [Verrucomicrobia bacterium]|nr:2-C-methyl-D-erythritol 2,4-cyclodiphosphate synthase [Verrucomicrobiota bacterium]